MANLPPNTENFKDLKIKGYTSAVAECCDNTFAAVANFFCLGNRPDCIGDCSLEWFSCSMCPWWVMMVVQYAIVTARQRSFGQGNIFTGICLSIGEGVSMTETPLDRNPPGQRTPGQRPSWTETPRDPQTENPTWTEAPGQRTPCTKTPSGDRPPRDRDLPWTETPRTVKSGRYASYWNAFLLCQKTKKTKKTKETGKCRAFIFTWGLATLAYLFAICSCSCQGIFHESLHSSHGVVSEL